MRKVRSILFVVLVLWVFFSIPAHADEIKICDPHALWDLSRFDRNP